MHNLLIRKLEQTGVLKDSDIEALRCIKFKERIVTAGSNIYHGEFAENLHLIVEGMACRYKIWADGDRRILSLIVPGDLCDGHAPLPFMFQTEVAALTTCKVADIPRQTMADLIDLYPRIARALWWITLVKLSTTQVWLANMGRVADKRVAHFFCELLVRLQAVGLADDGSYDFNLTQLELGEIFGLSNVHVNRVLKSLKELGLMTVANRRVTIPDVRRLKKFADFDPDYLHDAADLGANKRALALSEQIAKQRA
ncbi:Crp/Fnr family transcriptional regulator [Methylobacterium sp. ID0610]|uniref:Crp/Fnr family transcriptional regulator n=1 Tax=Methylobacterium carpenticola TaxID=3344827 RepID=UPI0036A96E5B